MCARKTETVRLEFDREIVDAVYDRFGDEPEMVSIGDDKITITVETQINPSFWGWVFSFGRKMKVISPEEVKERQDMML